MAAIEKVTQPRVGMNHAAQQPARVIPIDWLYGMLSPVGQRKYLIEHEQALVNRLREQRALTPA